MVTLRPLRSAAAQPARLGHRSLQPALPVLHAGAGLRLAAAREHPDVRGNRRASSTPSRPSASIASGSPAASRCSGATCPMLVEQLAVAIRDRGSRADDQRRPAAPHRPTRCGRRGCTASPSASTRCSRERFHALTRFDELPAVLAGIDAAARAGFTSHQDRHGRHPRPQRRRARRRCSSSARRSAPRCASSNTWTSAAPRTGRERRRLAPRDPRAARGALRPGAARCPDERLGPGRALPAARRHDLRHHRVDDRAVLRRLRPQPPDRRRLVAAVPLRAGRPRPAPPAARGRDAATISRG